MELAYPMSFELGIVGIAENENTDGQNVVLVSCEERQSGNS